MSGRSGEVIDAILQLLAPGRPIAVLGEAGMGTTTAIDAATSHLGGSSHRGGALRSLQDVPFLALNRAIGAELGHEPASVVATVAERVGSGVLAIDDLQWADAATLVALPALSARVRVLVSIRIGDQGAAGAQTALAAAGGVHIRLPPLDDAAAAEIVRVRRPAADQGTVAALVAEAGGNPQVLEHLLVHGAVVGPLAEALVGALGAVTGDGRRLLALLALAPDGVPVDVAGAATRELVDADLVVARGDRITARHRLVAAAALDDLDAATRVDVHRAAAGIAASATLRTEHLVAAGDLEEALPLALAAAADASLPERHRLLELASRCASGADRLLLAVDAVDAALAAWDRSAARTLAEHAAELPGAAEVPQVAAALADARARDGDVDGALLATATVPDGAPGDVRARAVAASAMAQGWPGWRPAAATTAAEEARAIGDARATPARAVAAAVSGAPGWWSGLAALPAELAPLAGLWAGAPVPATPPHAPPADVEALASVVAFHTTADCDGAAVRLRRALDGTTRPIDREVLAAHLSVALADSGRAAAATDLAAGALASASTDAGAALLRWSIVEAEVAGGRLVRARRVAADVADRPASPARCLTLLAAGWAAVLAPEPSAPEETDPPAWPGVAGAAVELRALGLRHRQDPAAAELFAEAAAAWRPTHRRGDLRCRWAAAHALVARDPDQALDELRELEAEVAGLGQRPLVARIRATMRHAGLRTPPARGAGRGPLSAREVEVLELVRLGFTTTEAAQSLGVAPSTVETQVESAMRKLGARTRVQAAVAMAALVS